MRRLATFIFSALMVFSLVNEANAGLCIGCPEVAEYGELFAKARKCSESSQCNLTMLKIYLFDIESYRENLGDFGKTCWPLNLYETTGRQLRLNAVVNGLFDQELKNAKHMIDDPDIAKVHLRVLKVELEQYAYSFLLEPYAFFEEGNPATLGYFDFDANKVLLNEKIAEYESVLEQLDKKLL